MSDRIDDINVISLKSKTKMSNVLPQVTFFLNCNTCIAMVIPVRTKDKIQVGYKMH